MRDNLNTGPLSESDLDEALHLLHVEARTADAPMTDLRARVLADLDKAEPATVASTATVTPIGRARGRRRFPAPWASVAAAVVAAAVIGGIALHGSSPAPTDSTAGAAGTSSAQQTKQGGVELVTAQQALATAATQVGAGKDTPLAPGQFRHISLHAWWSTGTMMASDSKGNPTKGFSYLREQTIDRWVPADYRDDWLERRKLTGRKTWLGGTEPESAMNRPEPDADIQNAEYHGKCGDFFPKSKPAKVCGDANDWDFPEYYAGLPRDPDQLLARWTKDTSAKGSSPSTILYYVTQILGTGLAPADVRAAAYQALAKLPGIQVIDRAANLDGVVGMALGIEDNKADRTELILDPKTGQYIGDRVVAVHPTTPWIKPGTVTSFTSQTSTAVSEQGAK
ncbi:hypothetical protein F0L68_32370 [Solihabitans fulvus]|uniref:Uncharacterized protein n=1 Tax=Solihabitans fulvus TaxID=1892852 RepID=A0A5B2WPV6_9PSEU|nr:CU044_5270 family protein [Solihabitans fulvus]KAA2253515.1 hypothetical protein F0L68_32370 [Solihabitans fulvus]